jgi:2-methylisocitrate lyase-like PEP mutase family enzyme
MATQAEKGQVFRALHQRAGAFVIPNPWDVGSARLLAGMGFEALATTSAGFAFSMGKRDTQVGRAAMIEHVAVIASATDLPVSADLENGFGDAPEFVAETIAMAAAAGASGGSIEDASGREDDPIYDLGVAVERIRAAVQAARNAPALFTLTARAENYLHGRTDLADTIRRLQAYQEAGADVLYAPGLTSHEEIASVVQSLDRPVNVLVGFKGISMTLADASALGVKRLSVGSALARAAYGALLAAAREVQMQGTFAFGEDAVSFSAISKLF